MFDLGMSELLIIGIVALIVIGPRDLPELFRSLGRMTAKLRAMAREFSRAMEAAADEAGAKDVRDVANDLRKVTSPKAMGVDALRDAASSFEKWDPMKSSKPAAKPSAAAPAAAAPAPASPAEAAPAEPARTLGPNTQALADAQAAKRAAMAEAQAARKAAAAAAAEPAPKAAKAGSAAPKATTAAKPRSGSGKADKPAAAPAPAKATTPKAPAKTAAKPAAKPAAAPRKTTKKSDA